MNIRRWFVVTSAAKREYGEPVPAGSAEQPIAGAFVDPGVLRSFPGASLVATALSALTQKLLHSNTDWIPFSVGVGIGLVILFLNLTEPEAVPRGWQAVTRAVIIGILNALLLSSSVLGVYRIGDSIKGAQPEAGSKKAQLVIRSRAMVARASARRSMGGQDGYFSIYAIHPPAKL
jgi:hypothetical protein